MRYELRVAPPYSLATSSRSSSVRRYAYSFTLMISGFSSAARREMAKQYARTLPGYAGKLASCWCPPCPRTKVQIPSSRLSQMQRSDCRSWLRPY